MDLLLHLIPDSWEHYITIGFAVLGGLVTAASAITPLTSTPKDDEVLAKVKAFMHRFSVFEPKA